MTSSTRSSRRSAGYGLEDRVELTASLEDDEMADFYRAADVFAHCPAVTEPFGMTAVEAMAAERRP